MGREETRGESEFDIGGGRCGDVEVSSFSSLYYNFQLFVMGESVQDGMGEYGLDE